jgi:hypothetical protein
MVLALPRDGVAGLLPWPVSGGPLGQLHMPGATIACSYEGCMVRAVSFCLQLGLFMCGGSDVLYWSVW